MIAFIKLNIKSKFWQCNLKNHLNLTIILIIYYKNLEGSTMNAFIFKLN